jgi:hypothetical protein
MSSSSDELLGQPASGGADFEGPDLKTTKLPGKK